MPENFEKEERTEITNKDKFYFVLSYIPFLNLILYFNGNSLLFVNLNWFR